MVINIVFLQEVSTLPKFAALEDLGPKNPTPNQYMKDRNLSSLLTQWSIHSHLLNAILCVRHRNCISDGDRHVPYPQGAYNQVSETDNMGRKYLFKNSSCIQHMVWGKYDKKINLEEQLRLDEQWESLKHIINIIEDDPQIKQWKRGHEWQGELFQKRGKKVIQP